LETLDKDTSGLGIGDWGLGIGGWGLGIELHFFAGLFGVAQWVRDSALAGGCMWKSACSM
ncbi:MAG: hypothetical protein ABSE44_20335, partial [Candidatus Sulfotelmatobacter sp.]